MKARESPLLEQRHLYLIKYVYRHEKELALPISRLCGSKLESRE